MIAVIHACTGKVAAAAGIKGVLGSKLRCWLGWSSFWSVTRLGEGSPLAGLTVGTVEARLPEHRLFIHRLRRGGAILEAELGMTLEAGDVIALSAPSQIMVELIGPSAEEVED